MELETFFGQFELLADAPNGVQKLRELILQLAVQGKLVPQDPNDEPAELLLERIREEKAQLVKEVKIKKSEKLPPVDVDEMPFELPNGWEWVRLDSICSKITDGVHKTPKSTNSGIPFLPVTQLKNGKLDFSAPKYISLEDHQLFYQRSDPQKGDILMCKVGATIGVTAVVETDLEFSIFVQLALFKLISVNPYYLKCILLSSNIQNYIKKNSVGSAMPYISIGKLKNIQVSLPPLPEQKRIITKVNCLMTLCDELEAKLTQSINEREKLMETAVRQVLAA
jgi:type I restriction enzyme S subunit